MAAPNGYPSWAYNSAGQPALIVLSLTQFNALLGPGTWSATPFASTATGSTAPFDTLTSGTGSLQVTDIRAQQSLVENRIQNMLLSQISQLLGGLPDDPQIILRPDVLANDASLTS
jgi:hypothetical protein